MGDGIPHGSTKNIEVFLLAVGIGAVSFVLLCLISTIYIRRGNTRRAAAATLNDARNNKNPEERLRELGAVSPTLTLERWCSTKKNNNNKVDETDRTAVVPVEGGGDDDDQFVCAVCLEPVSGTQEIRELKCQHVFHRECLERWYLGNHFTCPLCHQTYFTPEASGPHKTEAASAV